MQTKYKSNKWNCFARFFKNKVIYFRIILLILILSIFTSSLIYSQNKSRSDWKDLKQEIISIFKKYIELNEDFKFSVSSGIGKSGKSYSVLREEVERYAEDNYRPKLETMKNIVCGEGDRELLSEYFKVLISTENSANEEPRWVLGDIYLCQSDLVISEFKRLKKIEQKIILNDLNFGFLNVTYDKEDKIKDYHQLKKKLDLLK